MTADPSALTKRECYVARRLARLFRIERSGGLARRPRDVVRRMVDRRAQLIDELVRLEQCRRSLEPWTLPELDVAMGTLAREVDCTQQHCLDRLAEIGDELRRQRGVGTRTGLRDGTSGQLLGSG
jgi:hypothetical protein